MIVIKEYGTRFKVWSGLQGRPTPPVAVVEALDADLDTGMQLAKVHSDPKVYRNLITFMSGRGRLQ